MAGVFRGRRRQPPPGVKHKFVGVGNLLFPATTSEQRLRGWLDAAYEAGTLRWDTLAKKQGQAQPVGGGGAGEVERRLRKG